MNPALQALRPYPMAELQRRKADLRARGLTLFDFGTGDPIEPTPSFIRQALIDSVPRISQYPSVAGSEILRQAAADYLQRRFEIAMDPATQIIPSAGSKESIFHLPLAFLDPASGRDTVIFGSPAYPVYESGTLFAGGRPLAVPLRAEKGFRLDLDDVSAEDLDRTAICWINYPHNPTGACVDGEWLAGMVERCRERGILLVADECYCDLWFDDAVPPPSLLQVTSEQVLAIHSCSKRSGMTGYRSGFVAGDSALVSAYRKWRASMGVASPAFVEAAGAAAWSDDAHVAERRAIFSRKRALLVRGLAERGIEVLPSIAGLYIWARVPAGRDADEYAAACLERGIVISPGGFFGPGGDGWFRLALVPDETAITAALDHWPD